MTRKRLCMFSLLFSCGLVLTMAYDEIDQIGGIPLCQVTQSQQFSFSYSLVNLTVECDVLVRMH